MLRAAGGPLMIASLAFMLAAAAASPTPCESLTNIKFDNATITSAAMVEEPAPAARGGGRGPAAPAAQGAPAAPGGAAARGAAAPAPRGGGAPGQAIPAHCRVQLVLKPTS